MRGQLRIDLADNCNIRCLMCHAYNSRKKSDVHFLNFDKFRQNTKGQLADWTIIQLGNVAEPTIHPQFADFVRYIRSESNATIHIVTNGLLLERYADTINKNKCLLQLSLDSLTKSTYEYIHTDSNYDRIIQNLVLLDTTRAKVLISFTLMNCNIDDYEKMVQFCVEKHYQMSCFPMILRELNGIIPENLVHESLWFKKAKLAPWMKRFYGNDYNKIVTGAAAGSTNIHIRYFSCDKHIMDLGVDSRGNTTLCFKKSLRSLADNRLDEIWFSEEAQQFRQKVDQNREPCKNCNYRQRCLAPSMSLPENHFSDTVWTALSENTKDKLRFDSPLPDEEQLHLFLYDISKTMGIFRIYRSDKTFTAQRLISVKNDKAIRLQISNEVINDETQFGLYGKMRESAQSVYETRLVENNFYGNNIVKYLGKYWAVPLSLGFVNLSNQEDRDQIGIIFADELAELKAKIVRLGPLATGPLLLEAYKSYNLVSYLNKIWAIPQNLGEVNLANIKDRSQAGILFTETVEQVRKMVDEHPVIDIISSVPVLWKLLSVLTVCSHTVKRLFWPLERGAISLKRVREAEVTISKPGTVVGYVEATSPSVYTVGFEYGGEKYPFFEQAGSSPHWVQVKLPDDGKEVNIYALRVHFANPDGAERMPSSWLLQGSNDGSNWIDMDQRCGQRDWKPSEEREFKIEKPQRYVFYRLYIVEGISKDLIRVGNIILKFRDMFP